MPRVSTRLWVLAPVLGALATIAQAQGLVSVQKMSAALANEVVAEAVAACARKGYTVTAVVVDLDGVRQANFDEECAQAGIAKIRDRLK
jgi:uncharacterized protein GlcG (DUF336 family)